MKTIVVQLFWSGVDRLASVKVVQREEQNAEASDMARRVAGLKLLRERAIRIYEGLERCRVEMDRLRSEALELQRECGCRFGTSTWDGIESSTSCPFCFA